MSPAANAAMAGQKCIEIRGRARDYAAQHGISLGAAFQRLGLVEPYQAAARMAAQEPAVGLAVGRKSAAAAQAENMVRLFCEAMGSKPAADAMERVRPGLSGTAASAEAPGPVYRPLKPAGTPTLSETNAAVARVIATYTALGDKHA